MLWVSLGWAAVVTVLLLLVIGVPLARIVGLRGFTSIAVAPAFAMTVICGSSVVLAWLDVPWSVVGVAVVAIVLAAVLFAARRLTRTFQPAAPPARRFDAWLLVAIAVAAALIAWRTIAVIQSPESISQTFDNVFHLNAVRWVLDTGSASAFEIGYMTNPEGPPTFYPSGWHALVTLVAQLSGASVPVAINGVVVAVSAVVWPLGILLLTRTLFGRSPAIAVAAGLLAASLPSFPLLLMDYGVLYPFQLGVALLPIALSITLRLLQLPTGTTSPGMLWWAIALVGVLPGMALVHPGALMGWLALSAPMVVVFVVTKWRRAVSTRTRIIIAASTALYLALSAAMVFALRPPAGARGWQPEMEAPAALLRLLSASPWYAAPSVLGAVAVIAGLVWALLTRSRTSIAALGMYVVVAILFVVVAAAPFPFRDIFTAPWYNNIPRVAALVTVVLVPLGAFGIARSWYALSWRLRRRGVSARNLTFAAIAGAAVVLVALQVGPLSAMPEAQRTASASFALTEDSPLLNSDEAALISRLDRHVGEDVAIAGSPWTGTSVAYALTGRHVLMPHIQMEISDSLDSINNELAEAEPGAPVCSAVSDLNVGFVLDFGTREVHGANHVFPGLVDLEDSSAVRLVDEEGDARLFEVIGCGG